MTVPCLCSLWGAILFARLPWSVGQAGVIGALLTFSLSGLTVFLTVLSIAAVSTSGNMRAGGAYFLISRTLGVEAGGSIGLVFFAANSVGITFYLVALAEEVDSLLGGSGNPWMIKAYASGSLLLLLLISMVGASLFTKLNLVVLAAMVISIIAAVVSFLMGTAASPGYTGPSLDTLSNNLLFDYGTDDQGKPMDFFAVLIIVFPAMTGIMAGANMSGDLKSPGESIGKGTLWAVFIAISVYFCLIVVIGASVERDTLQNNLNIMQDVCFWPPLIAIGLIASTVSSALGNLVGSGRILQALARDDLFPFLFPFKWGTQKGDEPIPATLFAWAIAQACIFIGSLDAVAAIISGFFLLVYWAVNASCLLMRLASAPNFRPKFRFFSWHTALAGAVACLVLLFLSSAVYASVAVVVVFGLFIYVGYTADNTDWGDVTQALLFHQVRKYLLRLDERRLHPKNWRPSLLLCVQDPSTRESLHLIDFANNLKKGGLYVIGHVVLGDLGDVGARLRPLRHAWLDFIETARIKAFAELTVAPTARVGYQSLVMCSGLGGLKPNTVCLPLPQDITGDLCAGRRRRNVRGADSKARPSADPATVRGLGGPSAFSGPGGYGVLGGGASSVGGGSADPAPGGLLNNWTQGLTKKAAARAAALEAQVAAAAERVAEMSRGAAVDLVGKDDAGGAALVVSDADARRGGAVLRYRGAIAAAAVAAATDAVVTASPRAAAATAAAAPASDVAARIGHSSAPRPSSGHPSPAPGAARPTRGATGTSGAASSMAGLQVVAGGGASTSGLEMGHLEAATRSGRRTPTATGHSAKPSDPAVSGRKASGAAASAVALSEGGEADADGDDPAAAAGSPRPAAGSPAAEGLLAGQLDEEEDEEDGQDGDSDDGAAGDGTVAQASGGLAATFAAERQRWREATVATADDEAHGSASEAQDPSGADASSAPAAGSATPMRDAQEYMDVVRDCLFLGRNVLLTRWFGELDKELIVSFAANARKDRIRSEAKRLRIDVWTSSRQNVDPQGALLLSMQLAAVLHRTDVWAAHTALRVVSIVESAEEEAAEYARLSKFVTDYRYDADIRVVPMLGRRARPIVSELHSRNLALPEASRVDIMADASCINEVIRHHCEQTCVLFTPLPEPVPPARGALVLPVQQAAPGPSASASSGATGRPMTDAAYLQYIDLMTRGLPPTAIVGSSGMARFVTTDL